MIHCEPGNINSFVVPKYSTWAALAQNALYSTEGLMQSVYVFDTDDYGQMSLVFINCLLRLVT